MMKPQNSRELAVPAAGTLEASAATLLAQGLLSRATAFARRGRFDSAELVLTGLRHDCHEGLDLLARIRAQQGRVHDAIALWTEALRIDPGNIRYRDGLRKAEQMGAAPWK